MAEIQGPLPTGDQTSWWKRKTGAVSKAKAKAPKAPEEDVWSSLSPVTPPSPPHEGGASDSDGAVAKEMPVPAMLETQIPASEATVQMDKLPSWLLAPTMASDAEVPDVPT